MTQHNDLNSRSDRYDDGLDYDSRSEQARGSMSEPGYDDYMPRSSRRPGMRQSDGIAKAKDRMTDTFNMASQYVTSHDMSAMVDDAKHIVRKHPRAAIIALAAVGFLLGRSLRRSR